MNHPKTSKWGFSTHYTVTNGNDTFTLSARFHPSDKYWFYISDKGQFNGILDGESFHGKSYKIIAQWYDESHWYDEVSYKEPKKPIEYHECE